MSYIRTADGRLLKALKLLKNKRVNLEYLKCSDTYEQYCFICGYGREITQQEFDLLKEVFNNCTGATNSEWGIEV